MASTEKMRSADEGAGAVPPPSILVVDQDEFIHRQLEHMFADRPWKFDWAPDCQTALDLLEGNDYPIVTTAISGATEFWELLRTGEFARRWPGGHAIVLTGYVSRRACQEAYAAGAWAFLQKPFDRMEVEHALEKAVEVQRLRRELAA